MATATKTKASKQKKRPKKKSTKTMARTSVRLPRPLVLITAGLAVILLMQAPSLIKRGAYFVTKPLQGETTPVTAIELQPMGPHELSINSLNIHTPLVYIAERSESAFQTALQDGVVHYPGTAEIGQPGNAYFFGHSSDLVWTQGNYKTVFALLPEIEIGDTIIVTDNQNHPYRYQSYETLIVNPDETDVLQPIEGEPFVLSVQTSYPVGTALQRFIVRARLVEGPSAIQPRE